MILIFVLKLLVVCAVCNGYAVNCRIRAIQQQNTRHLTMISPFSSPFRKSAPLFASDIAQIRRRFNPIEYLKRGFKRGRALIAGSLLFLVIGLGKVARVQATNTLPTAGAQQHARSNHLAGATPGHHNSGKRRAMVTLETTAQQHAAGKGIVNVVSDASSFSSEDVVVEFKSSLKGLAESISGAKMDVLILLIVTSTVIPLFKTLDISPIIGFLITGTALGPTGLNWVKDTHMIDHLGELGIVFFLFEMGLELSMEKLVAMQRDVFGLGLAQFLVTTVVGMMACLSIGLPATSGIAIGGSLALSSSAFVLQLLKDKGAMGSRHGQASFGILLFQDLAVVPLLIVVELLGKGGSGMAKALTIAGVKAAVTLTTLSIAGKNILDPLFTMVAKSGSQEAFLSGILTTVLLMSFVTQGIGLSNTLGAFLAGLLLAETRYHYQIEADIAPFRGLLLGFFFIDVGFSIDIQLLIKQAPKIFALLLAVIAGKAGITTLLSMAFGVPFSSAQQTGLLTAQVGEFAFVAFAISEKLGLLSPNIAKLLLTTVALSMAVTPALAELGNYFANKIDVRAGMSRYVGKDESADEVKSSLSNTDYVLVCGYGRVGKMICDILDARFVKYVAIDSNAEKAIEARNKGLPVFYGDVNRPDVLKSFDVGSAVACVVAIDDMTATNKVVISVRKSFPSLPLIVRAKDLQHRKRLETMFDDVNAVSPALPEDSVLLTLPFGGVVLQQLGVSRPEIDAILENFRKMYMEDVEDDEFDILAAFKKRLPPSTAEEEIVSEDEENNEENVEIILKPSGDDDKGEDFDSEWDLDLSLDVEEGGLIVGEEGPVTSIDGDILPDVLEAPPVTPLSSEVVYDADGRPTNKALYQE